MKSETKLKIVGDPSWPLPRPQDDIESTQPRGDTKPLADMIMDEAARRAIEETLAHAAQRAQEALDEYVWQVGDTRILTSLMASRDATQQALNVHREGHA